jgi:hypothetical protein
MSTFSQVFSYLFWPNPGNATYSSPKAMALIIFCALLIALSAALSVWRKKMTNPVVKKLSRSWPSASFWLGFIGLILTVSRVEQIQFISMRILWVAWVAFAIFFIVLQVRLYRARYYEVLPKEVSTDPRAKYLPKQKRR